MSLRMMITALALVLPGSGWALVPNLEGHITDPQRRLSQNDRTNLEKKLNEIQSNTHIDVACWISEVAPDAARGQGQEFYRVRGIGRAWDNGVFFMFPRTGRVEIIQEPNRPELTPQEVQRVLGADNPTQDVARRLESLADATNGILGSKAKAARPWGQTRPEVGRAYLFGALVVFAVAIFMSFGRKAGADPSTTA